MSKEKDELLRAVISRGEYTEAIELLDEEIWKCSRSPEGSIQAQGSYRNRAHLYLYCGSVQQARSDFDTIARLGAERFRTRPHRLHSDSEFIAIGVTYWMEGRKELALAFWRYVVSMFCQGRVDYVQAAVGVVPGLLLWFGAVHLQSQDDIDLVRKFYEKTQVSGTRFWKADANHWPGPIIEFFLGNIGEEDLLKKAEDEHNPRQTPDNLCVAHFALAIHARSARRYAAYKKHLTLAAPQKSTGADFADFWDHFNHWPFIIARYETL